MDLRSVNQLLEETYEPGLRAQFERESGLLGPSKPPTRWQQMARPFRRLARRAGEVWNVARYGADFYRDY